MPDSLSSGQHIPETLPFNAVFHFLVEPAFQGSVALGALNWRDSASAESRRAFNKAMRGSGIKIDGFRPQNIHLAPSHKLLDSISGSIATSPEIASAILKLWLEANEELHQAVVAHLAETGSGPDTRSFSDAGSFGFRPFDDWELDRDRINEVHDGFEADDLGLMLCLVSGTMPVDLTDSESEAPDQLDQQVAESFSDLIEILERLPAGASLWSKAVPEFLDRVAEIRTAKENERNHAAKLDQLLADIGNRFVVELGYLERSIAPWSASRLSASVTASHALALAQELVRSLEEYAPLREQAPVRAEEIVRAGKRGLMESTILSILDRLDEMMVGGEPPKDGPPPDVPQGMTEALGTSEVPEAGQEPLQEPLNDAPSKVIDNPPLVMPESPGSAAALDPTGTRDVPGFVAESPEDVVAATAKLDALLSEIEDLKNDNSELKSDLHDSRYLEEYWRLAYQKERAHETQVPDLEFGNVKEVVDSASRQFKDRLIFQLNSDSEVEENPFETPQALWAALCWLGTDYYESRMGRLTMTDIDLSVREACGWWYKSDQHDTTMGKYKKSYTTRVGGKTYWLEEHIGKGTNPDARYTIRVGFDWGKEQQKVIVGFIGKHQRSDAS